MSEKMIFCLGEGKYVSEGVGYQKNLMIFNKPVSEEEYNKVKSDLSIKNFKLPIAKWVDKKDMTDDEKENWSSYKQTGGFLKTLPYKDAWAEMWGKLSQEDKDFFKGIINFDSTIFEEITGIKVGDENLIGTKVEVKVGDKTYKAVITE